MSGLELLGIIASFASIVSILFAFFVYHRDRLRKTREEGNVNLFKERLKGISNNLNTTANYLQLMIRQADDIETPVRELQNMARGVRAGLLSTLVDAQDMRIIMDQWKVGRLLESNVKRSPEEVDKYTKS